MIKEYNCHWCDKKVKMYITREEQTVVIVCQCGMDDWVDRYQGNTTVYKGDTLLSAMNKVSGTLLQV